MKSLQALRVGGFGLVPGHSTGAHQGIMSVGVSRSAVQIWAPRTGQDPTVVASGALAVGPAARTFLGSHAASALDRGSAPSAAARQQRLIFSKEGGLTDHLRSFSGFSPGMSARAAGAVAIMEACQ